MYLTLALKNIESRKTRTALTGAGIAIGVALLVLLLGLSDGLREIAFQRITGGSPLTQLTVQTKANGGGILRLLPFDSNRASITPAQLEKISKIAHVKKAWPEMIFTNISSLRVDWMGETLQTDSMIFGVPYDYIKDDYSGTIDSWDSAKIAATTPALFSKKIIDIYNFTIAPTSGLPAFSGKDLSGVGVTILPNESTFFPQLGTAAVQIPAKLYGFSDKIPLVGITVPIQIVRQMNLQKDPNYKENYLRLHLQVDSAENIEPVRAEIKKMGLEALSLIEEVQTISENFLLLALGLGAISLVVLFIGGLMIASTFLSAVHERKHEIGIFRALGATRSDIRKIFLAEAALIGALGGISGIIIGILGGVVLNQILLSTVGELTVKPSNIILFSAPQIILAFILSVVISLIFAYIPANRASRLQPLEALG